jgi:hypothetical protein
LLQSLPQAGGGQPGPKTIAAAGPQIGQAPPPPMGGAPGMPPGMPPGGGMPM